MQEHHVRGATHDAKTVTLCRGCHQLVTMLARCNFITDSLAAGRLLELARLRRSANENFRPGAAEL